MKKIKALLYSAAFIIALSASFAFRPGEPAFTSAYLPTASCTTLASCNGGQTLCTISGVQAYLDMGTCLQTAFMHP